MADTTSQASRADIRVIRCIPNPNAAGVNQGLIFQHGFGYANGKNQLQVEALERVLESPNYVESSLSEAEDHYETAAPAGVLDSIIARTLDPANMAPLAGADAPVRPDQRALTPEETVIREYANTVDPLHNGTEAMNSPARMAGMHDLPPPATPEHSGEAPTVRAPITANREKAEEASAENARIQEEIAKNTPAPAKGDEDAPEGGSALQDPSSYSVAEVRDAMAAANDDEIKAVKRLEKKGQGRKGILEYERAEA